MPSKILKCRQLLSMKLWVCSMSEWFNGESYRGAALTSAVSSAAVQFVTIITHTAEHPGKVLARSKHANVLEITLVDVCGEERGNVRFTSNQKHWKNQNSKENKMWRNEYRHLDRTCCRLWEWSPFRTRTGSRPERSDTVRSHTGSRCLHTRPCLKQSRQGGLKLTAHGAHWTHTVASVWLLRKCQQSYQSRKTRLHWSRPCRNTCRTPVCWHSLHWGCSCGPPESIRPDLQEGREESVNLITKLNQSSQKYLIFLGTEDDFVLLFGLKIYLVWTCTHPHTWCRLPPSRLDSGIWSFQACWCRQHACRSYEPRSHIH